MQFHIDQKSQNAMHHTSLSLRSSVLTKRNMTPDSIVAKFADLDNVRLLSHDTQYVYHINPVINHTKGG